MKIIMKTLARIIGALALLAIALFGVFGFLASFEPGNGLQWKLGYAALGCGCLFGALALFRPRGGSCKPHGMEPSPRTPRGKRSFVKSRMWLCFILGCVTMGLLHLNFVMFWHGYYSHHPWTGYEQAMTEGHVPPFFTSSIPSVWITRIALFAVSLAALSLVRGQYWLTVLAIWAGVMLSVVIIWIATDSLRNDSNMWPIDFVVLSFTTALPLVLGSTIGLVIQKMLRW
jgi:magnesium-transporting ATPase (P-type)